MSYAPLVASSAARDTHASTKDRYAEVKLGDSYAVDNFEQPHPEPPSMLRELDGRRSVVA